MAKAEKKEKKEESKDTAREQWLWEDKRRRTLVERFGEVSGTKRFEAEKAAGFVPSKMWPAVK